MNTYKAFESESVRLFPKHWYGCRAVKTVFNVSNVHILIRYPELVFRSNTGQVNYSALVISGNVISCSKLNSSHLQCTGLNRLLFKGLHVHHWAHLRMLAKPVCTANVALCSLRLLEFGTSWDVFFQ